MAFCGYCGAEMPDELNYCIDCGKPLIKKKVAQESACNDKLNYEQKQNDISNNIVQPSTSPRDTGTFRAISDNQEKYLQKKTKKNSTNIPRALALGFALIAIIFIVGKVHSSRSINTNNSNIYSDQQNIERNPQEDFPQASSVVPETSSNQEDVTETVVRVEKDSTASFHQDVQIASCRMSVPINWEERGDSTSTMLKLTTESGKAFIQINTSVENADYSIFKDRSSIDYFINTQLEGAYNGSFLCSSVKYYETDTVIGILGDLSGYDNEGNDITGKFFILPTKDYKHLIQIQMVQSYNTKYLYNDDFIRMLDTIEVLE